VAQGLDIGIPKERKPGEGRVALVPEAVAELVRSGHRVRIEQGAGAKAGFADGAYRDAGAEIAEGPEGLYGASRLIIKVKEPIPEEYDYYTADHVLFSFLHLAAAPNLAHFLGERGLTAFAFETWADSQGNLPLLAPMSFIAGRVAVQYATTLLHAPQGGKGVLLGGAPGTDRGNVVVLGAGVVGGQAARLAANMGARVDVFDLDLDRADRLATEGPGQIAGLYPYRDRVSERVAAADLVVGAVLVAGARAPHVVSREQVAAMEAGSVVADVAVDQGGCIATTRPTSYDDPTYTEEGVVHFAVTNMPAAVPRTATRALSARLLPFAQRLAHALQDDLDGALEADPALAGGLNVRGGAITHPAVARALEG
jgi:alanine dehydrogenase